MEKPKLTTNKTILKALEANLSINKTQYELYDAVESDDNQTTLKDKTYTHPIRLGKLLDDLLKLQNKPNNSKKIIKFGEAILDTRQFMFSRTDGKTTTLTEKETEILIFLHNKKPEHIPRNNLLKAVWKYAESVETHTLETHIYRLRQKIETDPSNPKILMTNEKGYSVI